MGWMTTIFGLLGAIALGLWARRRATMPTVPGKVRYVPYTGILFLAVLSALLMLTHLLTLLGVALPSHNG